MVEEWIDQIVDLKGFLGALSRATHDAMVGGYRAGSIEVGYTPDIIDPKLIRLIQERTILISQNTAQRLRGDLKQAIIQGITNKEGVDYVARRIREVFDDLKTYETERIARTEMLTAFNASREAAWAANPFARYKMWLAKIDRRTGDDSKRMSGQIVKVGEPFTDPEDGATYNQPPMRPNDRCTAIPLHKIPDRTVTIKGLKYDANFVRQEALAFK